MDRGRRREADIAALKRAFIENATPRCEASSPALRQPSPSWLAEAFAAAAAAGEQAAERGASKAEAG